VSEGAYEALAQAIAERRETLIRLIQELVRRPSVGQEGEVQAYIAAWWRERGIEPDIWEPDIDELRRHPAFVAVDYDYRGRPNLVVQIEGAGGGRSLTLNGHADVVPADPNGAWTHADPYSGALANGRIYGRGSMDMKAGLALAMTVMEAILRCGIRLRGSLQLQSVVDEENGGNGTLAAILRGYRSDATIFLEASSPQAIVVSGRGAQFFRITVPGVEGGIELKFSIPNAIEKAMKLFQAVDAYALWRAAQAKNPLYDWDPTKIPVAVCSIRAGNWPSTLASKCIMEGSLECLPGEDIEQIKEQFRAYLLETARQDPWLRDNPPAVEWFGLRLESAATPVDHPLVTSMVRCCEQVLGCTPCVVGGGGSDLRLPVLYADSPSIIFGPSGGALHGTDEYVDVESVMQTAQVLGRFILDWCGVV